MDVSQGIDGQDKQTTGSKETGRITAHRSSPERVVFTECGNTDGWIATDVAVSLER